jgi:lauroyl/myristoyl acyltransferase
MSFRPLSKHKDLSCFFQKQPNIILAKLLPFSIYRKYLSIVGLYYYGVNKEERNSVLTSLRYILGDNISEKSLKHILRRTYRGIFEHYVEKMFNAHKPLSEVMDFLNDRILFSGRNLIDQIISEHRGCILVTGHFGAVEYIPLFLASNYYRPSIILRFKTKKLREALVYRSKSVDLELIDVDSPKVIYKALTALKKGRLLITLCDEIHSWKPCPRERAKLFGHCIPKDRTLDIIHKRSKAPLCFGVAQRTRTGYDLSIHPIANGGENCSVCEISWSLLEKYVYSNPEQWYQWPNFYSEFTNYISHKECYGYSKHQNLQS